jgi:hypothetical protein
MIHLWNIRPGKTLRVGSIALLKEHGRQQSRRLKLSDLLLLLLRCALIILLALLLAKPLWRQYPSRQEKGWVLIAKEKLPETYRQFQPVIDSLLKTGYTFHYFEPGFKKGQLSAALQQTTDTLTNSTASYWALLANLQQQADVPRSLFLYTTNYLGRFRGQRPAIDTSIHWYAYTPADSVANWWADAYVTTSGSIRARKVTSSPSGNAYTYQEQAGGAVPVKPDTATTQITIFADTYAHDARYLKAAIAAIQQFTQRKMQVSVISQPGLLPQQTDWLFWLSMQPVPEHVAARNVWQYDSGKVVNTSSRIISPAAAPIALYKRILPQQGSVENTQLLWQDGFGNAVLRLEKQGNTARYHFSSRLDPAWNELPWHAAFPGLLLQLFFPDSSSIAADKDRRIIAAQQLQPDHSHPSYLARKRAPVTTDLTAVFWVAIVALFFAERALVFKNSKLPANG